MGLHGGDLFFYAFWGAVLAAVIGGVLGRNARAGVESFIFQLLTLYAALFFSALTLFLLGAGSRAGWKSDGPGILGLMLVIAFLGLVAMVCWTTFVSRLGRDRKAPDP